MKKILNFLTVFSFCLSLISPALAQDENVIQKRRFLVTAYYSPLPDQSFYIRGSYEADIKLNGRGTNGADGTQVFMGMLAAPRTYAFGTRIYMPELGVGEVHDRGGAIIAGADYDRIDVWMGKGEEGLARALNWGARVVEGEIHPRDFPAGVSLDFTSVSAKLSEGVIARLQKNTVTEKSPVFSKPLEEVSVTDIEDLQIALTFFGFYNGPIEGKLDDSTREAITNFQLSFGIIKSAHDAGAGEFGPLTRATLQDQLKTFNAEREKEIGRLKENLLLLSPGLGKNESGDEVTTLQRMLWELGVYSGPLTGKYDGATIDAVFLFQKTHDVLQYEADLGAGYYGGKTHEALVAALEERIVKTKEYPKTIYTWIPPSPPLPTLEELTPIEDAFSHSTLRFDFSVNDSKLNKKIVQENNFTLSHNLQMDDKGEAVLQLQRFLIKKGYLKEGFDSGYYGQTTADAVTRFQLDQKIISKISETGAGRVGPKTRAVLNDLTK